MKPISKMVLRMYAPSVLIVAGGLVVAETIARTQRLFGGFFSPRVASLSFLLAILVGMAWAMYASWRLWRWSLGRELRCACGGMMSRPRPDRQGRMYRRCLGCGSKTLTVAKQPH